MSEANWRGIWKLLERSGAPFRTRRIHKSARASRRQRAPSGALGDLSRQAVTKHLDILEALTLVASVKQGRERKYFLNAVPIQDIADRWIGKFAIAKVRALENLKEQIEQKNG